MHSILLLRSAEDAGGCFSSRRTTFCDDSFVLRVTQRFSHVTERSEARQPARCGGYRSLRLTFPRAGKRGRGLFGRWLLGARGWR